MTAKDRLSDVDATYHNATASQYEEIVNTPRRFTNDLLFNPLLRHINEPVNSLLDLGCGTGQMVQRLAHRFTPKEITAVDHSSGMLDIASAQAAKLGISNIDFTCADVPTFVSELQTQFDLVSCVGLLHHLTLSKSARLIENALEVVRPGGWLLIAEPVYRSTLKNFPAWLAWWNRRSVVAGKEICSEVPEPEEAPLPDGFLVETLNRSGFSIVKISCGIEIFPWQVPPSIMDKAVIWITSRFYRKSGFVVAILAQRENQARLR